MDAAEERRINAGMMASQVKERLTRSVRRYRPIDATEDVVEMRGRDYDEILLKLDLFVDMAKVTG
jgi:hypothetical protein